MKYLLILLGVTYFVGGVFFFTFLGQNENKEISIENIKKSIAIIIPENELISYKNNPKGLFKDNEKSGIGAGFFTNEEGIILTTNHTVENENINYNIILNGKEYKTNVVFRNKQKDIANLIINTDQKIDFNPFKITNNSNTGELVYSFGIDIETLKIIYNTGTIINTKSELGNMSNLLEISNILKPGFSGGPIINNKGEVIGMNYATSQGKNYGIKF